MNRLIMLSVACMLLNSGCVPDVTQRPRSGPKDLPDMTMDQPVDVQVDRSLDAPTDQAPDVLEDKTPDVTVDPCSLDIDSVQFCAEPTCEGQVLTPSSELEANARFGESVAIHGEWLAVGAPGIQTVFLYQWHVDTSQWVERHSIFNSEDDGWFPDDVSPGNHFGSRVAINSEWLVIAEPNRGDLLRWESVYSDTQRVYFIRLDQLGTHFMSTISNPVNFFSQSFGASIALSNQQLYVGHARSTLSEDVGYAIKYGLNSSDENDSFSSKISDLNSDSTQFQQMFGTEIAVQDNLVAISSYLNDSGSSDSGVITLYSSDGRTSLASADPKQDALFGLSTSFGDGFFVVGAPSKNDQGVVEFFERTDNVLTPKHIERGLAGQKRMGYSVAAHGAQAVAGDPKEGGGGSLTFFSNVLCDQVIRSSLKAQTLKDDLGENYDLKEYGYAVAHGQDWVVVGAPGSSGDEGAVHVIPLATQNASP